MARVIAGCANPSCHLTQTYTIGNPSDLQSTGCVADNKLINEETVLNFPTKVVQRMVDERRVTLWLAPGLSCFALKLLMEEKRADGTWHPLSGRRAVKVTLKP